MAEGTEISFHEVEVVRILRSEPDRWWSNRDLAERVRNVTPRTVRAKTAKLVTLGLCEVAEIFPNHLYRWSAKAAQRNGPYLARLQRAADVLSEYMASLPDQQR